MLSLLIDRSWQRKTRRFAWRQFMFKRFSANYSLWPERVRPRRSTLLTRAAEGFAVGVVCAIAAYNVITDFVGPATVQEPAAQSVVGHVPILAPAVAPSAAPAPAPLETVSRGSRTRAAAVTLPIIGWPAALPTATDGRSSDELASGASVAGSAASSGDLLASLIREEGEPARQPPAQEAGLDEAKPAAATEHPVKPRKKIVQEKRERPASYVGRYRQKRERPTSHVAGYRQKRERPTSYAAGYRQGPVYPTIWY
jgi:hypothetical protein